MNAPCGITGMKNQNSRARRSAPEATAPPKTVDDYLAAVPEPARSTLHKVRAATRSALPAEAIEAISYRIPESHPSRTEGWGTWLTDIILPEWRRRPSESGRG